MTKLAALLAATALALLTVPAGAAANGGAFVVACNFAKFEQIDPIFSFGAQSAHLHIFKGNKAVSSTSTHATLRATPASQTVCSRNTNKHLPGSGDLSAYWAPALVEHTLTGERNVPIVNSATYYKGIHHAPSAIQPFPPGIKLLATPSGRSWVRWECTARALFVRYPAGGVECVDSDLDDGRTPTLTLRAYFPSCWNGTPPSDAGSANDPTRTNYDDTATTHYPAYVGGTGWTCPSSHPIPLPQLELIFNFQTSGGADVHVASHDSGGEHADFFEAWDQGVMSTLMANCVRDPGAICEMNDDD